MTSKNSINEEIEVSCSSFLDEKSCSPQKSILFEAKSKNSWICFDFKKRRIIPKYDTIRSYTCNSGGYNPKKNNSMLNGFNAIHTFRIENANDNKFKYLHLPITNLNWTGNKVLAINSIEFYGKLL